MNHEELQSIKLRFGIIGNSEKLNRAIEVAALVAPTDSTVLITGESGSGKESFSKIIHQLSARKHGEFIAINCGALPEGTINSELFGHEKGAFTGATEARKGYFEVTDKGTIFLDEIAETPLETQARLLRLLENKEFIRVGSSKVRKTDVRVVAATNVDLIQRVDEGKFRKDLYYRLSTIPIYVPPLRERGDDVELLFRKFATDFAEANRSKPLVLDEPSKMMLTQFRWPGNIRQLKNIVEQMSVMLSDRHVNPDVLRQYLPREQSSQLPVLANAVSANSENSNFSERDLLYKVLFDMRKEMADMKKMVLTALQKMENGAAQQVLQQHKHLFHGMDDDEEHFEGTGSSEDTSYLLEAAQKAEDIRRKTLELERIEDITHKMEDETLSLQKNEKEMIKKALKKNNNKRKDAARDLGISERTLYRKIKLYDIDE